MKKILVLILVMTTTLNSFSNLTDSIPPNQADISSPGAIIKAVYDVISGPAGEKRNWDRMRTLFIPEARMMPTGKKSSGEGVLRVLTLEEYIGSSGLYLERNGFFETEIGRKTEQYGNILHVFSTYESRKKKEDKEPFMRGINSFQLWNDGKRWWVISILWESESKDNPIPQKYIGAIQ